MEWDTISPKSISVYHPRMVFYEDRLTTFKSWPKQIIPDKHSLSRAGLFYSGESDTCVCAFCNLRLSAGTSTDIALAEHFRHAPGCVFLKLIGYENKQPELKVVGEDIPPSVQRGSAVFPPLPQQQQNPFCIKPNTFQFRT